MQIQEIVSDVKGRLDKAGTTAQDVVKTYVDTLKQANNVVVDGVQTIARSQQAAVKDLFDAAVSSFEKARDAGIQEVVSKPVAYLPEGRDTVIKAYEDTLDSLLKTRDQLGKVVKNGYETITVDLGLKAKKTPVKRAKTAAKKASTSAKKATTAASKTVRKTATKTASAAKAKVAEATS